MIPGRRWWRPAEAGGRALSQAGDPAVLGPDGARAADGTDDRNCQPVAEATGHRRPHGCSTCQLRSPASGPRAHGTPVRVSDGPRPRHGNGSPRSSRGTPAARNRTGGRGCKRVGESAHLPEELGAGRLGHGHGPLDVGLADGHAVSASTSRLQVVRPRAACALATPMKRTTVLTALATLRLSGATFHEPFQACAVSIP